MASIAALTARARPSGGSAAAPLPLLASAAVDGLEPIPLPISDDHRSRSEIVVDHAMRTSDSTAEAVPSPAAASSQVRGASPTSGVLAGTLTIDSHPVGATVFVDGQPIGTAPMLVPDIVPGLHVIQLRLPAHRDWESTVRVVPDDRNRVTATLIPEDEPATP